MPLTLYKPSVAMDLCLSKVYTEILLSGDGEFLFGPEPQTLSTFFWNCQSPRVCIPGYDEGLLERDGFWFWSNLEPCFSGGFLAVWMRPEKRGSKQSLLFIHELYDRLFDQFPVIMGVTKRRELLEEHEGLGYEIGSRIPGLWNGADVWLMTVNRAQFQESRLAKAAQTLLERGRVAA